MNDWSSLFGIRIMESPLCANVPKMQLSPKVAEIIAYAKPEFVAETNEWMRRFFGTHDVAYMIDPSVVGLSGGRHIVTSPRALALLRNVG